MGSVDIEGESPSALVESYDLRGRDLEDVLKAVERYDTVPKISQRLGISKPSQARSLLIDLGFYDDDWNLLTGTEVEEQLTELREHDD